MKKLQSTLPERGGLSERGKDLYFAYAMLLPAILVFLIVIFLPIVKGIAAMTLRITGRSGETERF